MKKVLRFIGILLLVLIVGFLIVCAIAPKDFTMERTTSIKGSKQAVMDEFVYFKNWVHWSPFREMDTTIVVTIEGTDGQPGSTYRWVGKDAGEGKMTHRDIVDDKMTIDMEFIKPFQAKPTSWLKAEDEGNGMTKVTWGYHDNYNFLMAGMMKTMGMFGMGLDKSFDRGLFLMKKHMEENPQAAEPAAGTTGMDIKETQFAAHTYAGMRKVVKWDDMSKFFMDSYSALGKSLPAASKPASGIYWTWDTVKHETDMAAVFPVPDAAAAKGASKFDIPASKAYMIEYHGPYTNEMSAHNALAAHIAAKKEQRGVVIEEYVKGPGDEKDSTKWVTNIYYLVK